MGNFWWRAPAGGVDHAAYQPVVYEGRHGRHNRHGDAPKDGLCDGRTSPLLAVRRRAPLVHISNEIVERRGLP